MNTAYSMVATNAEPGTLSAFAEAWFIYRVGLSATPRLDDGH